MLGLKLPTDPRWVNIVEQNIAEILTDHAFCEQKAVSNAIFLIVNFPEYSDIVQEMSILAQEELTHFKMVHDIILKRGLSLGRERRDPYVNDLMKFVRSGFRREVFMVDRLLFSALIEARSCERFRILSENIRDPELAVFYRELMISEANHYTLFLKLARKHAGNVDVESRWKEFLEYEGNIIRNYGKSETMHG
jgi:tRNA 2-(methylsulfanyl)-N6-isopentenyladenosine37 hydroxylase